MAVAISAASVKAQTQPPAAARPSFEVASVKRVEQPWLEIAPRRSAGRITWTTDLWYLIGYAYRLQPNRISGPIPGSDFVYRVEATTGAAASDDQIRLMLQSLLVERFHMVSQLVTKDVDAFVLSVGKSGPKMVEAKAEEKPPLPPWFRNRGASAAELEGKVVSTMEGPGIVAITGRGVSMRQFAEALQRTLGVFVQNDTGLTGNYYFGLRYAQPDHPPETDALSVFAAIQQDLGLKMEKRKVPVESLVVDRIDKVPAEN